MPVATLPTRLLLFTPDNPMSADQQIKNGVLKNPINRKEYNYSMKGVTLDFKLQQDNNSELLIFKEILEAALADVIEDLSKIV